MDTLDQLEDLPDHLVIDNILPFVRGRDVCALSCTNRHFYHCLTDATNNNGNNSLWKSLLESDFVNMMQDGSQSTQAVDETREKPSAVNEGREMMQNADEQGGDLSWISVDYGSNHTETANQQELKDMTEGDHVIRIGDRNYRDIYVSRAMEFYNWKNSLYSTRRRRKRATKSKYYNSAGYEKIGDGWNGEEGAESDEKKTDEDEDADLTFLDVLLDGVHLLLSYVRVLTWMFVNPKVQPPFVPIQETYMIKRKCLDAGSYLITTVMCFSLIICGLVNYVDQKWYMIANVFLQAWILFSCFMTFKYGSMTTPLDMDSTHGKRLYNVSFITWVVVFASCVITRDLMLNNLLLAILSITLAISRSLLPMIMYGGDTIESLVNAPTTTNDTLFHGTPLVTSSLNGTIVAVVLGIGGIKFTIALILLVIVIIIGGNPSVLRIFELTGGFSPIKAGIGILSGAVSFLLYYVTKWSLVTGGFPKRKITQRLVAWFMLMFLFLSMIALVVRASLILFGFPRWLLAE